MRDYIPEADFAAALTEKITPYLEKRRTVQTLTATDGTALYTAYYRADAPRGTLFLIHGFSENADKYRALEVTMNQYETCKKWGGNLLLNIAPAADGSVPEAYYKAVKEFGEAVKAQK
jgi:alpha-L-fucosidase